MSEIVNLNKRRKAKARTEKEVRAKENRKKYGRTRQEKLIDKMNAKKMDLHLEAHKRDSKED